MRRPEAAVVCFGITLRSMLVAKSCQNPSKMKPKPSKIEFGKPFWLGARPGGTPGVPWGQLGVSRASFWDDLGFPNSFKISQKSTSKNDAF